MIILSSINDQIKNKKTLVRKVYYLSTCSTCKRIISELGSAMDDFEKQDIKKEPITTKQVDEMQKLSGSYAALFSKKARKYRTMNLGEKSLAEKEYRELITQEYTFLKRPVFVIDNKIFIGSDKKNVEVLKEFLL